MSMHRPPLLELSDCYSNWGQANGGGTSVLGKALAAAGLVYPLHLERVHPIYRTGQKGAKIMSRMLESSRTFLLTGRTFIGVRRAPTESRTFFPFSPELRFH